MRQDPKGRRRAYGPAASGLGIVRIGSDWAVLDLRGLLRNARWRTSIGLLANPVDAKTTWQDLLSRFTGNPVIHPTDRNATLTYKERQVLRKVRSAYRPRGKDTREKILEHLEDGSTTAIGLDLGVRHPIAAVFEREELVGSEIRRVPCGSTRSEPRTSKPRTTPKAR